eukprot:scaffold294947_cov96-Cyclotella_meneghiniana.AAC.1
MGIAMTDGGTGLRASAMMGGLKAGTALRSADITITCADHYHRRSYQAVNPKYRFCIIIAMEL